MAEQLRSRTVGCKVTEQEYGRIAAEAERAKKSLGEWCREVLLERVDGRPVSVAEQALMAELLALRAIVLNTHFAVAKGEAVTAERMQQIIDRADGEKAQKAIQRIKDVARVSR